MVGSLASELPIADFKSLGWAELIGIDLCSPRNCAPVTKGARLLLQLFTPHKAFENVNVTSLEAEECGSWYLSREVEHRVAGADPQQSFVFRS